MRKLRPIIKEYYFKLGLYETYQIVTPDKVGQEISIMKPDTTESIQLFRIFKGIQSGFINIDFPAIKLYKFKDVKCYSNSDFIITSEGAVWPKYFHYNYTKNYPLDEMMVCENNGKLFIKRSNAKNRIDVAFSLLGAHCDVWSHNLSEYFTKLSMIEDALEDAHGKIIYVLVPEYKDKQLKEVIYTEIEKHSKLKPFVVQRNTSVEVKTLYFVERPSRFNDHSSYIEVGDSVQPKVVADIIKEKIVIPYIKKYDDGKIHHSKIFLARKGKYRNLENYAEVEDYFKNKGYIIVEPHKLTLQEKINVFKSAEYVVGPFSSAFSNIIFCKPGTKALMFSNYSRAFEGWLMMHQQHFDIDFLLVTGKDHYERSIPHCNYTIPIERIKEAAVAHGIPV